MKNDAEEWIIGTLVLDDPSFRFSWDPNDIVRVCKSDLNLNLGTDEAPCAILRTSDGRTYPLAVRARNGELRSKFDWPMARRRLLDETYAAFYRPPFVSRLPFDYNRIPPFILTLGLLIWRRAQRRLQPTSRQYRLDVSVAALDLLNDHVSRPPSRPNGNPSQPPHLFLTYDMDRGWLFRQEFLFERVLALLGELGIKATWFVVPVHSRGRNIQAKLRRLLNEGHEIGMHGIRHDTRLASQLPGRIRERFDSWRGFSQDHQISGFRAPWLFTSPALEEILPEFFLYDSSVPTMSLLTGDGSQRGCCSVSAFRRGRLPVLPITLPWEGELLAFQYSPDELLGLWLQTAQTIIRLKGTLVFLGHWDPQHLADGALFQAHEKFLRALAGKVNWAMLPATYFRDEFAVPSGPSRPGRC